MKTIRWIIAANLMTGVSTFAQPATPAEAPQAAPADSSSIEMGEIVVTANRREQSVQKVGATITALSGQYLADAKIRQPADLSSVTSGLSTVNFAGDATPVFAIRGIGLDDFNPNNSSGTAVYIDNIYQTGPVFLTTPLFDVARVEVLKGPQGSLYGKNATGGAISFYSNMPGDTLNGNVSVGYGRWQTLDASAAVGGPLGGGFSARVAGVVSYQGKGYQRDIDTGKRYGKSERYAGRALLRYEAPGSFDSVLNVHLFQDNSTPVSYQSDRNSIAPDFIPFSPCGTCSEYLDTGTQTGDRVRVGDLNLRRNETNYGASLTSTAYFDFANFLSIFGYDKVDRTNVDNNDGLPVPGYDYYQDEAVKQYYGELRLTSNQKLFDRTSWILGTNYSEQRFRANDFGDQSFTYITQVPDPVTGLVDPSTFGIPGLSVGNGRYLQVSKSLGIYLHTTTDLAPKLRLVAGVRYAHDKVSAVGVSTEEGTVDGGILFQGVGATVASIDESHNSNKITYKIGLEYDIADQVMGYASVASGTKSGVYHLGPSLSPSDWRYAKPEDITSYEIGLKSRFLDNKVTFNISGFYYDYRDRQTSVLFVTDPGDPVLHIPPLIAAAIINLPKARVIGIDADASVKPVRGLTFSGMFTYLDAKVKKTFNDVDGFPLLAPVPLGGTLAQTPKYSFALRSQFEQGMSDDLTFLADLSYVRSSKQLTTAADPQGFYGPNSSVDGRVTLRSEAGWSLGVWGKNLTNNNDIIYAASNLTLGRTYLRRKPISYGAELGYRF